MPYSTPGTLSPVHRCYHSSPSFTDEKGHGAFISLGALPRRSKSQKKTPVFHLHEGDDDEHDSDDPSHDTPVPFPTTSPAPSRSQSPLFTRRTTLPHSSSIILSNGKPLKSSLKSSLSTPSIPEFRHPTSHTRAQSAPSTPFPPKNVHFAEKDGGLESVKVFSRSARPASLSTPNGDDTETETEGEPHAFPFPPISSPPPLHEIDSSIPGATSPVPALRPPHHAHIHLESIALSPSPTDPALAGTLLVRNLSYEKHVAARFTLDDWQTTSEVGARYVESLPALPPAFAFAGGVTAGDVVGAIASSQPAHWDRFAFTLPLTAHALPTRTLWLVARYTAPGLGEWWDNNAGRNYRVAFRARKEPVVRSSAGGGAGVVRAGNAVAGGVVRPVKRANSLAAPVLPRLSTLALSPPAPAPPSTTTTVFAPHVQGERVQIRVQEERMQIQSPTPTASPSTSPRLRKLNLLNYAAPVRTLAAPSISYSAAAPSTSHSHSLGVGSVVGSGVEKNGKDEGSGSGKGALMTPPMTPDEDRPSPTFKRAPLPPSSSSSSSSSSPRSSPPRSGSPTTSSTALTQSTAQTQNTSGQNTAHAKFPGALVGGQPATGFFDWPWALSPSSLPSHPHSHSWGLGRRSPPRSGTSTPTPPPSSLSLSSSALGVPTTATTATAGEVDSDALYQAFVKQWCFAQSPPPSPSLAPGGLGGLGGGVLVG